MAYVKSTKHGSVMETDSPAFWCEDSSYEPISAKQAKAEMKAESLEYIRGNVKPGDTVFCLLRHVSTSGMSRSIDFFINSPDGLWNITYHVSRILDMRCDNKHGGLKVTGCGMDMGFHVVYCLGHAIWPNGTPEPHGTRNGEPDSDGGYALKSVWL